MLKTHEVLPSGYKVQRMWWFRVKFALTAVAAALIGAGLWAMLL